MFANQLQQGSLELLDIHGFSLIVQELGEFGSADAIRGLAIRFNQGREGLLNIVLTNAVDWSMVHKQGDEAVEGDVSRWHSHLRELTVFHFVDDILHFLLGGVVAHSAHQVGQLINRHLLVLELAGFCCVFFFGADYTVVEEIVHVLEGLALASTLNKINEWFNTFTTHSDSLFDRGDTNFPHIHS